MNASEGSDGPEERAEREISSNDDAYNVACAFLDAIVWGEHYTVWELFSADAREYVLRAAARRGMDAVAAERARQGTWHAEESDAFLRALVLGLRVDLSGVDLDLVTVVREPLLQPDDSIRFELECRSTLPAALTGGANWAAGAVIVSRVSDGSGTSTSTIWRVERLIPRPAPGPAAET